MAPGPSRQAHSLSAADMTQSRREQTLRRKRATARNIVETALDAFRADDENGAIRSWNTQAEKIFGWQRRKSGKGLIDLIVSAPTGRPEDGRGTLPQFPDRADPWKRRETLVRGATGREFKAELSVTALKPATDSCSTDFPRPHRKDTWRRKGLGQSREDWSDRPSHRRHPTQTLTYLTVLPWTTNPGRRCRERAQLAAITRMIERAAARGRRPDPAIFWPSRAGSRCSRGRSISIR